ncbi:nucleoside-diphosphate-sugar epimerase [Sphingobium sp. B7D2B]|uniref:GDP-mannose 4,6-dehydratase n=1 Tax=Sphingobium sp. B7D2B TaxID=2940583 RepID=UPI002224A484|nr:GDP-mannose 4,6-dehydratase [Sphingobium sp. B7D2B]MCW2366811.1 nucleoside-diphosphate-sugar epimerase [Sphingobium sp. B7D2B]
MAYAMRRILITGAGGFTGRALAKVLADKGMTLIGVGASDHAEHLVGLSSYHQADLSNAAALTAILREESPDGVIHLAGIAFVGHADISAIYDVNVVGTRRLLQSIVESGIACASVILASSANVYGSAREGALDETTPLNPQNDYAVSKVAMEFVANVYRERLPITIARPFNYTGVGQSTEFLIAKIVDHARRRAPIIELGNLDVARDFSDVRVIAEAYARLLNAASPSGSVVNLCSGRSYSLREILHLVSDLSGHEMEVVVNPALVRPNEIRVMSGDPARLEALIGPIVSPSLEETLAWMLKDGH